MIHNLDKIVFDSTKYIAEIVNKPKYEVYQTYIKAYSKQQDKHVYRIRHFHISKYDKEQQKIMALRITGRYYRRQY